jgi:hypothetical protein
MCSLTIECVLLPQARPPSPSKAFLCARIVPVRYSSKGGFTTVRGFYYCKRAFLCARIMSVRYSSKSGFTTVRGFHYCKRAFLCVRIVLVRAFRMSRFYYCAMFYSCGVCTTAGFWLLHTSIYRGIHPFIEAYILWGMYYCRVLPTGLYYCMFFGTGGLLLLYGLYYYRFLVLYVLYYSRFFGTVCSLLLRFLVLYVLYYYRFLVL